MKGNVYPNQPFLIHVRVRQPLSGPSRVPFLVLLLVLIHPICELPLTKPILTPELVQVVHPVKLSQHCELFEFQPSLLHKLFELQLPLLYKLFELQLQLLRELFELLHDLIAFLYTQILVLTSKHSAVSADGFSSTSLIMCL